MFKCCKNCGHETHSEICYSVTFKHKCTCKIYELQKFADFDEIYQEYERLLFESEKHNRADFEGIERIKFLRQRACMTSKIRILKKWIDDNKK